ncbi:MAG: cell division protein ZapA [Novosphingobium sp.]|nr:cell division protein ZapA [Novosphingobium sp.]
MSNVDLSIGGRGFTVACASGEEQHVASLGRLIDAKLRAMGDVSAQSESRTLLFAALLLADEVHDLRLKVEGSTGQSAPETSGNSLVHLDKLAERLENLAARLESEAATT